MNRPNLEKTALAVKRRIFFRTNHSALRKTLLARFRQDGGPHETSKRLGVSTFTLVMFAHGYSKLQGRSIVKLEKKLSGRKVVAQAARRR